MNKKELQARLIENNVKDIMQSDYVLEVMNRDDDNHFIVVREYDYAAYDFESPLEWLDEWTVVTDTDFGELIDLLGDYVNDIYDKHSNIEDFFEHVGKYARRQGLLVVPLSKYEHSGVDYSRGVRQGWDTGVCGFAYLDIKDVKRGNRFSCKQRKNSLKSLDNMLTTYSQWCNGDVYCITSYDTLTGDIIDSIGQVYTDDEVAVYVSEQNDIAIQQA